MNRNRHKNKVNNHPEPKKTKKLIDAKGSSYSPNSIGGRIDLESLRDKLFSQEVNNRSNKNKA